jgi:hypothetical protein
MDGRTYIVRINRLKVKSWRLLPNRETETRSPKKGLLPNRETETRSPKKGRKSDAELAAMRRRAEATPLPSIPFPKKAVSPKAMAAKKEAKTHDAIYILERILWHPWNDPESAWFNVGPADDETGHRRLTSEEWNTVIPVSGDMATIMHACAALNPRTREPVSRQMVVSAQFATILNVLRIVRALTITQKKAAGPFDEPANWRGSNFEVLIPEGIKVIAGSPDDTMDGVRLQGSTLRVLVYHQT